MTKSWAARLCRLPQTRLFVAQELINKVKIKVLRNLGLREIADSNPFNRQKMIYGFYFID